MDSIEVVLVENAREYDGHIWQLVIPSESLLCPVTITMTELTNVTTDAFASESSGGVLLEPDGLTL
jgi:hypothetical protein